MLSMGVRGGLRAGVRRLACLLTCGWAVLALCGGQSACGQQPSAARPQSAGPFSAAGIGTGTRTISGLWQFHLGDDPAWAQPGFDDHTWERLPADRPWGDVGHPSYTGFAWYRREITLDPAGKEPLALLLPPLNSAAEVYWNGVKVGGIGILPPHANWPNYPEPVAIPLPSAPGAHTGELAIRIWMRRLDSGNWPNDGGILAAPQLGHLPLVQTMTRSWWEHRFRLRAATNACVLLFAFVGMAALVLWARTRSHWVLLAAGAYLLLYALKQVTAQVPLWHLPASIVIAVSDVLQYVASVFLILLLADLPGRSGIRGARFWWRASLVSSGLALLGVASGISEFLLFTSPYSRLFHVLDLSSELLGYVFPLFEPVLLIACFLLSRFSLPRLLFLSALGVDVLLGLMSGMFSQNLTRADWLVELLFRPMLRIYGSVLTLLTIDKLLVLLAILYAVSKQIGRHIARQRFMDDELRAAHEVQRVLVPSAAERETPGYAISSVYRPASEVGGDFFQVIPLDDGALIVAGDVSGKGLRAAMTVSLVVGTLRTLAEYDTSPASVLAGLNRRLLGRTQGGFVTCCAVRIDAHGRATMANAGHCQPYLDDREVILATALPLGIVENPTYEEIAVNISHGQQLTLLSDGVVEARNHHGELYGFDRLNQLMQERPTAEHVADTAVTFGQDDDITVLTVTRLAAA